MRNLSEYDKQAIDFLKKCNVTFECEFLKHYYYFSNDTDKRDIYKITLKRGNRFMTVIFGNSINNSGFYFTMGKKKVEINRKYLLNDSF